MTLILRPAAPGDFPGILEIEQEAFSDGPWVAEDFTGDDCTVAVVDGRIVGFLVSRQTFPAAEGARAEREILNLAVRKIYRGRSIAKALLQHELERRAVHFLEVRESNVVARRLYRQMGFEEVGRRPEYYDSPVETAIVMRMK
ncbi:MAG: ribosomal protein S18-alanine N-acetyltransferase [Acidobacteriaceae bacterium]|nr:ribosomal protein S18-alanine N-acetyltransferase [Acidobacteriaceae bacterium]